MSSFGDLVVGQLQEIWMGILTALLVALHAGNSIQSLLLAVSVPHLSLLLPHRYNLKYQLTDVRVAALLRQKALGTGYHQQGFCLWNAGCHLL